MKVITSYNNFSRGKIDHDMMGRYDLPIYTTGSDVFQNFISNFKGNAIYRPGFKTIYEFQDCAFIPFKFSNSQNYLCVFFANKIRFLSYDINGVFGWVLDGGAAILEVATPYTLAEAKELQFTQNADVMYVVHSSHEPRKLVRTSANSFTFRTFARTDDPFATYQATKTITGITQASAAVVTAAGHGYSNGDKVKFAGVLGMTQINGQTGTVTVIDPNTFSVNIDSTAYTAYSSAGTSAKILTSDYPACALLYKGRLYYAATPLKPTTVWASESANYDVFTLPGSPTDTSALQFTIADTTQNIEWLFGGDNSLIAGSADGIWAINGGDVGSPITSSTVEANITSADGCNGTYPIRKDGFIFYVSLNSRILNYFAYDLLSESFKAEDANFISYDITKGGISKIAFKKDRNDLIYAIRDDGVLLSVNFKKEENIVGWHSHETEGLFKNIEVITDNDGNPELFALVNRGGTYWIEQQSPLIEFSERSSFDTGDADSDDEAYNRLVAEELTQCNFLDNALMFSDLKSNLITYNSGAGTITATSGVFVLADEGKHIVYKTATGYESGRFLITNYVSSTVVEVSVLQEPTANTYTDWYLTFNTVSGLSQFNGDEVAIVTDGGYLNRETISGGALTLDSQTSSIVIGYPYKGIIKSFCLGFQVQGSNTQATFKAISRVGVRCVTSAGGNIGSSLYRLEPVQELSQNDLNYLPPIPIDGTKYITYVDDNTFDKFVYIVQEDPLPLTVASMMVEANYAVQS